MTVSLEQFSGLVSDIYGAALDPERREPALRAVVTALGGEGGALLVAEPQSRRFWNIAFGIDASMIASYDAYYGQLDPVATVLENAPAGAVIGSHEFCDPAAMRRSEFYADWAGPVGTGDGIVASLVRDERATCWMCCSAPLRSERFATEERLRLMRLLVPHLQQALRAQVELSDVVHAKDRVLDVFDHTRPGMAWIAAGGRIVHANAAAAALLREGQGLVVQARDRLRAALPNEDSTLQRMIRLAARGDNDGIRAGGSLIVSRPHGRLPLVVHVMPTARDAFETGELTALAVIVDMEDRAEPPPELLQQLFQLTPAETTVVLAMLHCAGLKAVADELSVSLSTVRTHLQRAYDKMGIHRQADLACFVQMIGAGRVSSWDAASLEGMSRSFSMTGDSGGKAPHPLVHKLR